MSILTLNKKQAAALRQVLGVHISYLSEVLLVRDVFNTDSDLLQEHYNVVCGLFRAVSAIKSNLEESEVAQHGNL
jgi:hypothetical protein